MIFEYALPIMMFLVLINWRGDGRNVACIFLLTSVVFNWIIGTSEGEEAFVLYAVNELVMLLLIRFSSGPERLVRDMILISIFSIVVQHQQSQQFQQSQQQMPPQGAYDPNEPPY